MSKHYLRLPNRPEKFIEECQNIYKKYKNKPFEIIMSRYHHSTDLTEKEQEHLNTFLPEFANNISFNRISDAGPPQHTHIDRGRKAALQVPLVADPEIHKVYVIKDEEYFDKLEVSDSGGFHNKLEINKKQWKNQRYPNMPMFHIFKEEYFDINPVEPNIPYINDTSLPHGGIHYNGFNTGPRCDRYFLSFSIPARKEVSELKEIFKDWV